MSMSPTCERSLEGISSPRVGARGTKCMFKSIQWTLQMWHAGLLAVVLVGFGAASYFGISRARWEQLDSELARSVQVLTGGFRPPKLSDPSSRPASTTVTADGGSREPWR